MTAQVGAAVARRSGADERALALAGAAGALTAFLGFPIAGAVFAHELLVPSAGLGAAHALPSSILATVGAAVACALLRGGAIGGHFTWGATAPLPALSGYAMALGFGVAGALVGGFFVALVDALRSGFKGRRGTRAVAGLAAGLLALRYPQTLFWGEQSLQTAIDGRANPAALLFPVAMQGARASVDLGFGVGAAKLVAIAVAVAAGVPGGVIFPLFFAAGGLTRGCGLALPAQPALICSMAALQAGVTRTPMATVLMLAFSARTADLATLAPLAAVAAYTSIWTARALNMPAFFSYPGADEPG